MAGETVKCRAVCLSVRPWSRTSHVVSWLAPVGKVATSVKGAVRPKSAFLGQYDLNYTCEIVYYARAHGEVHALRECTPLKMREGLRGDFRALALAGYLRFLVDRFVPQGDECGEWLAMLENALDFLESGLPDRTAALNLLVYLELRILALLGLRPELESESGRFALRGERTIPVSREAANLIGELVSLPSSEAVGGTSDIAVALDVVRVIGVYYTLHLDLPPEVRRSVLGVMSKTM